jgi:hypothetical protein
MKDLSPGPADSPASVPDDNTTLLEVLASYQAAGFRGDFSVADEGLVLCHTCRTLLDPNQVDEVSLRRLEGASDPADMLAVVAIGCPACDTDGILLLNYGPEASAEQATVLLALNDHRGRSHLPDAQTPDESDASAL